MHTPYIGECSTRQLAPNNYSLSHKLIKARFCLQIGACRYLLMLYFWLCRSERGQQDCKHHVLRVLTKPGCCRPQFHMAVHCRVMHEKLICMMHLRTSKTQLIHGYWIWIRRCRYCSCHVVTLEAADAMIH
jgi:hypothetical protein